jgi:hypothetical protein
MHDRRSHRRIYLPVNAMKTGYHMMNNARFDHIARLFATTASRRKVMRAAIASVLVAGFNGTALDPANAKDNGKSKEKDNGKDKPKPSKPDQGNGKGGGNEKVSVCHNGHTIEVAQPAVQAHLDHGDSLGACAERQSEPAVSQIPSFRVSVDCSYSAEKNQSTCTCSAEAADGGIQTTIHSLLVPRAEICSDIVGGEFTEIATAPAGQQTGYRSSGASPQVTLVFSGRVTVGGSANYWCASDAGLIPAPGPGFVCAEPQAAAPATAATATPSEISDSTGAIIVEAYSCGGMVSTPTASSSWYDRCLTPMSKVNFQLTSGSGTPVPGGLTADTDVSGRAQFTQLQPGSYTLDAVGANWCHAESDDVDSSGNLLVRAGAYCHVWIFFCGPPMGS